MRPSIHFPHSSLKRPNRNPLKFVMVGIVLLAGVAGFRVADSTLKLGSTPLVAQNSQTSPPEAPAQSLLPVSQELSPQEEAPRLPVYRIFYPASEAPFLVETSMAMDMSQNRATEQANLVLKEILAHTQKGLFAAPVNLLSVFRMEDTLVLDFGQESLELFHSTHMRDVQLLYSLVNSLLESFRMEKLRLLFGGRPAPATTENLDLNIIFTFNHRLVLQSKPE